MALQVPSFANPSDPSNPLVNAYAWIPFVTVDLSTANGRIVLFVHPNEAAADAGATPAATLSVSLGQVFVPANPSANPPVAGSAYPTLAQLMADAEFASAFATIEAKLFAALVANVPALAGSTIS